MVRASALLYLGTTGLCLLLGGSEPAAPIEPSGPVLSLPLATASFAASSAVLSSGQQQPCAPRPGQRHDVNSCYCHARCEWVSENSTACVRHGNVSYVQTCKKGQWTSAAEAEVCHNPLC